LCIDAVTAIGIFAAGIAGGTVNAVVGSGSLITFPTLLAAGYSPVVANVSNTVGMAVGNASGAVGYRAELAGQGARMRRLALPSLAGGITGAVLLLVLPEGVFDAVVPVLILGACLLIALQPRLRAYLSARRPHEPRHGGPVLLAAAYASGIYGGYFGAAQGVILVALLAIFLADGLQRLNGLKNALVAGVNGVAALMFMVLSDPAWGAVALLAVSSALGGQVGAKYGRRLPPAVLRGLIIVVGVIVAIKLIVD
jgi:uncharacterized protein